MPRTRTLLVLITALLLITGCRAQVPIVTTTPLPTNTPDLAATEAVQAFIGAQTAVVDEQANLAMTQTAVADTELALQSAQADIEATAEALQAQEMTLQANAIAERATLDAEQTAVMEDTGVLQESIEAVASEQAALASDRQALELTQAAIVATNEAYLTDFSATAAAQDAALEGTLMALAAEQTTQAQARAEIAATQTALIPSPAPPTPTLVPSLPPADTVDIWQQVTLDDLNLSVIMPPKFIVTNSTANTVEYTRDDDPAWPSIITFLRMPLDELFGNQPPTNVDQRDPVALLNAALDDPANADLFEVLQRATPLAIDYPGATANVQLLEPDKPMVYTLLEIGENDWVYVGIFGNAEDVAQWVDPIVRSIRDEAAIEATEPPAGAISTPVPEATPAPSAEDAANAIGVAFAVPEGWQLTTSNAPDLTRLTIDLSATDGSDNLIGMARFTPEEFSQSVGELPTGLNALEALEVISQLVLEDSPEFSGGRINEFAIGAFSGAWTQYRTDSEVNRLYLFPMGQDDWLLIGAFGPRDTFNDFSRTALRDFLQSLEPMADEGVALGLNFIVPEGWELTDLGEATADEPAAVSLTQAGGDDTVREIIIARGESAQFAGANMPADAQDATTALQPVAEIIRDSGDYGTRLRVDPLQIGMFNGATASLRGDNNAARVFLFDLSGDDWLLIIAYGSRDSFNAFAREELKTVLDSLSLASGTAETQTVEPIGPIEEVIVSRVSDGDTIYVMLNGLEESVRIIGVDTPEAHHPSYGADPLGYAATHYMLRYIDEGSTVYLESDLRDRDDFNRLLRYVWIKDEADNWVMLEAELIRAGMAHVRTYDEDRYVPYFLSLEREAQAERLGVWGDPQPAPPTEALAEDQQTVWVANPDGAFAPLLYDAAALGNVPDPVAVWPNNLPAVVEDVYYVYPTDIDPVTGEPVAEDRVGYWYWLEINDFRGWVPEAWLLLEAPDEPFSSPDTDIIAYAEPFVVSEAPLPALSAPGDGEVMGTYEPESRIQVRRLSYDPQSESWWLYADTQTIDGWVPLAQLNRLSPENR